MKITGNPTGNSSVTYDGQSSPINFHGNNVHRRTFSDIGDGTWKGRSIKKLTSGADSRGNHFLIDQEAGSASKTSLIDQNSTDQIPRKKLDERNVTPLPGESFDPRMQSYKHFSKQMCR
ncbi:MAG: hypothetical protein LBG86_01015 [Puniceicoccales bacterium]|jgi:hypothetical protein|nr:hypothetical protein [Puniceicoccales bacterium]